MYGRLARYYDVTHSAQGHGAQADFVDAVLREYGTGGRHLLDIACGTGEHAKYMVEKGYDVTGIDLSDDMLAVAKAKRGQRKRPLRPVHHKQTLITTLHNQQLVAHRDGSGR